MVNGTNTSSFWQGGVCGAAGSLLFNAWIVPFLTRAFDKVGAGPEEVADAVFRWIEQYIDLGISSGATCGVLPTRISFDLSTTRCRLRSRLQQSSSVCR